MGVLSTSYLSLINLLCCAGVIAGGFVASWHYITTSNTSIDPVEGATLGAGAGVVGSLLSAGFDWILRPLGLDGESIMENFAESMSGMSMEDFMQGQEQAAMQEPGMGALLVGLIMGAILWAVFGAIGGALGGSLLSGDDDADADVDTREMPDDDRSW